MIPSDGSVSRWIELLKAGDQAAAQKLWEQYFQRMVELARQRLGAAPRRVADEEDVALSAFNSFCLAARDGRYPQLLDRDNLWPLLFGIIAHKAVDLARHETRQKRGGVRSGAAPARPRNGAVTALPVAPEPTPDLVAQMTEEYQRLLDRLGDPGLQAVAVWKMEGYTTEEIAAQLGCVGRTVERKLRIIRKLWSEAPAAP